MTATADMLTPRSPARITIRRATSHADPTAAATDDHRNLAAALRYDARDATRALPFLMRAAHAAGNPAGVETLWQELLAVLGTDLDLVDEDLHPDTIALYTSLRGSRRPRPAQQGRHSTIPQN